MANSSDNFTPDKTPETSDMLGKTQEAVQSPAMRELQMGEWGTVCKK